MGHGQRGAALFLTVGLVFFYGGLEPRRDVLQMVALNLFTIAMPSVAGLARFRQPERLGAGTSRRR